MREIDRGPSLSAVLLEPEQGHRESVLVKHTGCPQAALGACRTGAAEDAAVDEQHREASPIEDPARLPGLERSPVAWPCLVTGADALGRTQGTLDDVGRGGPGPCLAGDGPSRDEQGERPQDAKGRFHGCT